MDESDVRQKIDEGLERQGYWVIHFQDGRKYPCQCPRCKKWHSLTVTPEVKGRPDLWGFHPSHPGALIEVKMIAKSKQLFAFSQVEEKQRDYLSNWVAAGGQAFIGIGKIVPLGNTKTQIAAIHVFPWTYWLETVESRFSKSIAYDWSLYKSKPKDWQSKMDVVSLDPIYTMLKDKDGFYFNPLHPLAMPATVPVPFFLRGKKERHTHAVVPQSFPVSSATH